MNLLVDGDPVHMTLRLLDDEAGPFCNHHILEYKGTEAHFDGCRMDTLYKRHDSNVGAGRLKMTWWCEPSSSPMPLRMPRLSFWKDCARTCYEPAQRSRAWTGRAPFLMRATSTGVTALPWLPQAVWI